MVKQDLEAYGTFSAAPQRRTLVNALIALLGVAAFVAVASFVAVHVPHGEETMELEESDNLKSIDDMLKHINKITAAYKNHQETLNDEESHSDADAESHSVAADSAKTATSTLNEADLASNGISRKAPTLVPAAKTNNVAALKKQIEDDYAKVTEFGKEAGYLPPIKGGGV
jgi:hypothetical protein